jgi:hypothetical protein
MRSRSSTAQPRGAVLPLLAVSMVALMGFVALAVDIGMVVLARTQCQNAADGAAMAGARALNGLSSSGYDAANAPTIATSSAATNKVETKAVQSSQVQIQVGSYTYDYTQNLFVQNIPTASNDTPNLVQASVSSTGKNLFGQFLGGALGTFNVSATATAVHRPRDVAVIMDLSGSMRFDSLLGIPYSGSRTQSNNPETNYPVFGHYSGVASSWLQNPSGPDTINDNTYGLANDSTTTNGGGPIVGDFYSSVTGTGTAAFTAASTAYATTPAGDKPLWKYQSTTTYGKTVQEITTSSSTSTTPAFLGYTATPFTGYSGPTVPEFKGYTTGPNYWGKTFFIWPPDPRTGNDWRANFFNKAGSTTAAVYDSLFWDSNGNWQAPSSSTYSVDYTAILNWIKNTGPNPFPSSLQAGRIVYYTSIPTTIDTSSYPVSDPSQRFWKEYIDFVLGLYQTSSTNYDVITPMTGYGDDVSWGTPSISQNSSGASMRQDNPERPLLHFWFGPMTMIDFLGNYNLWCQYNNWNPYWPGTCHESPLWACKLGIQAALMDIQNNHPNDFVSMMFFNNPQDSASDSGCFNRTRVPLGRDYQRMSDTLWFPPTTINSPGTTITPYDAVNNPDVPRASGGTTTVMGFMLAYNQFSSNPSLRTYAPSPAPAGEAGGYGRQGAQRLIILETDGMANNDVSANFANAGSYNSYFNVRMPGEYPQYTSNDVPTHLYAVASQICALNTASPPGYSTTRKPVLIHCIAEGPIFDPTISSSDQASALALLQNLQYIGGTQTSPSTPLAPYKIINGTGSQRTSLIQQAFSNIMQDGVQVSLIQ